VNQILSNSSANIFKVTIYSHFLMQDVIEPAIYSCNRN